MNTLATMFDTFLGFAMILFCTGLGMLSFLRHTLKRSAVILFSGSLFLNSLGFVLWAGTVTSVPYYFFIAGEFSHFTGFMLLGIGCHLFSGQSLTRKTWSVIALAYILWICSLFCGDCFKPMSFILLRVVRSLIFIVSGVNILRSSHIPDMSGKNMAGSSLIVWGIYVLIFKFIWGNPSLIPMGTGLLIGFHILAIIGIIQIILYKDNDHLLI